MSAKGGQKEGMGGQRPKSRAKEGHGRAPSQKQGSLAAMPEMLYVKNLENQLFLFIFVSKI